MGRGPAQVLESVVGVPAHATLGAALGVGHLRRHGELLGHQLGGNLGAHRVHRDGQPVRLFAAEGPPSLVIDSIQFCFPFTILDGCKIMAHLTVLLFHCRCKSNIRHEVDCL